MKRIAWIIAAVLIAGFIFNSCMEKKSVREAERAKRESERAESARIRQAMDQAVSQMASLANAVDDWEESLSRGKRFRFQPIFTVELEKHWLQQRPILFTGTIKDIASHDRSHYVILVEKYGWGGYTLGEYRPEYSFRTILQLSLIADKDVVDTIIDEHPEIFDYHGGKSDVAVVARIESIRTSYITGDEGSRESIRIGDGELIDILYTGDAYASPSLQSQLKRR